MTSTQPTQKKPVYLRPVLLLSLFAILSAAGILGYAKAKNYSVKTMAYVFVAGFNTPKVSTTELQQGKLKHVVMVDVRDTEEYTEDHIGNSLSVPITEIKAGKGVEKIRDLAKTFSKPNQPQPTIVLYCQSGPRSIEAYQSLKNQGLNLVVLAGGIKSWREVVPPSKDAEILSPIYGFTNSAQVHIPEKL